MLYTAIAPPPFFGPPHLLSPFFPRSIRTRQTPTAAAMTYTQTLPDRDIWDQYTLRPPTASVLHRFHDAHLPCSLRVRDLPLAQPRRKTSKCLFSATARNPLEPKYDLRPSTTTLISSLSQPTQPTQRPITNKYSRFRRHPSDAFAPTSTAQIDLTRAVRGKPHDVSDIPYTKPRDPRLMPAGGNAGKGGFVRQPRHTQPLFGGTDRSLSTMDIEGARPVSIPPPCKVSMWSERCKTIGPRAAAGEFRAVKTQPFFHARFPTAKRELTSTRPYYIRNCD